LSSLKLALCGSSTNRLNPKAVPQTFRARDTRERLPIVRRATARTFGIKYRPHEEHHRGFDGRLLLVGFDPDGTVGQIKWWKWDGEFSDEEIERLLKKASAVSWRPVGELQIHWIEQEAHPNQWVGEQDGKIIFDADESDTGTCGPDLDYYYPLG
jgi:hypothetical protein